MTTQSSTMTPITTRRVLGGGADPNREGVYLITLDGDQLVETDDRAVYDAARRAKFEGKEIHVELEPGANGAQRILELAVINEKPVQASKLTQASKSEPPAAASTAISKAAPTSSSLSAANIPQHAIVDATELAEQLRARAAQFNVLTPAIAISHIAQGYAANLAAVVIDSTIVDDKTGRGTETYRSGKIHKPNERALNKNGLLKISQAMGVQWMHDLCVPLPVPRGERNLWRWKYVGYYIAHDGQPQYVQGSKELDLRDGSAEIAGMSADQIKQMRAFGNEICETKAMERAIRALGVRQLYTVDELAKPFLIPRFSFVPDMNDPEIKKLVTERALSGMRALYPAGAPPAMALPAHDDLDDAPTGETTGQGSDMNTPPTGTKPTNGDTKTASADGSQPSDVRHIADAKVKRTGKVASGARAGQPWTLFEITATTGECWSTFSESHYKSALEAKEKGWAVRIEDAENEKYPDQRDLKSITLIDPRQPNLPIGGGDNF